MVIDVFRASGCTLIMYSVIRTWSSLSCRGFGTVSQIMKCLYSNSMSPLAISIEEKKGKQVMKSVNSRDDSLYRRWWFLLEKVNLWELRHGLPVLYINSYICVNLPRRWRTFIYYDRFSTGTGSYYTSTTADPRVLHLLCAVCFVFRCRNSTMQSVSLCICCFFQSTV